MKWGDWQQVYREAWDLYYSAEHIETILRRAKASGINPVRLLNHILQFYFTFLQENVHPLQGGYFRRKLRRERRAGRVPSLALSNASAPRPPPRGTRAARQ